VIYKENIERAVGNALLSHLVLARSEPERPNHRHVGSLRLHTEEHCENVVHPLSFGAIRFGVPWEDRVRERFQERGRKVIEAAAPSKG